MAGGSKGMTAHLLWVFQVEGGAPFRTKVGGNPSTEHNGGTSVFHLMLEEPEAKHFTDFVESLGCTVTVRPSRKQSPEQEAERSALLGVGKEDVVWPCERCPTCYWFDPVALTPEGMGDPCGYSGWPEDTRRVCLESTKAVGDLEACPLKKDVGDAIPLDGSS